MFEWMDARAKAIPLEADHWWRGLARAIVARDGRGYRVLGADLAKHVKRRTPFNHGMLSAFATGKLNPRDNQPVSVTFEFAEALCAEFPTLPPPVFIPRSFAEATQLTKLAATFDDEPAAGANDGYIVTTHRRRRRARPTATHATTVEAPAKQRAAR